MDGMKKRLAISAMVGAGNFVVVFLVFKFVAGRHPQQNSMLGFAVLYGLLFGLINALVTFGVGAALKHSSDSN
jgi:hypothetical protein